MVHDCSPLVSFGRDLFDYCRRHTIGRVLVLSEKRIEQPRNWWCAKGGFDGAGEALTTFDALAKYLSKHEKGVQGLPSSLLLPWTMHKDAAAERTAESNARKRAVERRLVESEHAASVDQLAQCGFNEITVLVVQTEEWSRVHDRDPMMAHGTAVALGEAAAARGGAARARAHGGEDMHTGRAACGVAAPVESDESEGEGVDEGMAEADDEIAMMDDEDDEAMDDEAMGDEAIGDEAIGDEAIGDEAMGDEAMGDGGMGDGGMGDGGMGDVLGQVAAAPPPVAAPPRRTAAGKKQAAAPGMRKLRVGECMGGSFRLLNKLCTALGADGVGIERDVDAIEWQGTLAGLRPSSQSPPADAVAEMRAADVRPGRCPPRAYVQICSCRDLRPEQLPTLDYMHFSPECTSVSRCAGDAHPRTHANGYLGADDDECSKEYNRDLAWIHRVIVDQQNRPGNEAFKFTIEAPEGVSHHVLDRFGFTISANDGGVGATRLLVHYCKFGMDYMKPTCIWSNLETLIAELTDDGSGPHSYICHAGNPCKHGLGYHSRLGYDAGPTRAAAAFPHDFVTFLNGHVQKACSARRMDAVPP